MFNDFFSMDSKFSRIMNYIYNLILLSILWLLCCVPIITIGASCTAAYYTAAKVLRHKTGSVFSEFFSSFKSNFSQSILMNLVSAICLILFFFECMYFYSNPDVPLAVLYLFYGLFLYLYACTQYMWAFLSRFSNSTSYFLRASLMLPFKFPIKTVLLLLLIIVELIFIYLMPWGLLIFPGAAVLAKTYILEPVLKEFTPAVTEDDINSEKWFYQ